MDRRTFLGTIDRRTFLGMAPLVALGAPGLRACAADGAVADASTPTLDALGVQLYTLREAVADDLDATLAAVAEIGYEEVELFQLHGLTPGEMRGRLDAVGLRAASSHYGLDLLRDDLDRHVDGALELGQSLMVVPSIPSGERSAEGLARVAGDFDGFADAVRQAGLRFGYHNHDWEFRPLPDGTVPMDLLLARTDPGLVDWQMDVYWTVHGGGDPSSLIREHGGRVTSVHVKDRTESGQMVDVGDGVIDFATVLAEAEAHGLMHAFVEHDRPGDALESVRRSYRHLEATGVVG